MKSLAPGEAERSEPLHQTTRKPGTFPLSFSHMEIAHLISELAEPALREHRLLMRPIPFFARYDQFHLRENELKQVCNNYLAELDNPAAGRFLRAYAFADELSQEVLRNFYPLLPAEGESAQRMLMGAAMVMDQLLDEDGEDPAAFASIRTMLAKQTGDLTNPQDGNLTTTNPRLNTFVSMLEDILTDCRVRGQGTAGYAAFIADLLRMLDAELASPSVTLDKPPVKRVRDVVRDKSALLVWVGFQACCLGQQLDPTQVEFYQEICNAIGEVLWIMDDLADLEEDLERGIWNRSLWRLHDDLGEAHFKKLISSQSQLAEGIISQAIVRREIEAISERVVFIEAHPRMKYSPKLRAMMSFWITSWLGIYR